MSKDSLAKYYQNNKENYKKKLTEEKSIHMIVSNAKIYQKKKTKSFLSIEKILKNDKTLYYNYRKLLF